MSLRQDWENGIIRGLQILAPYFKPTWVPAFERDGIFITLNPGYKVEPRLWDIDRKIVEACEAAGMVSMKIAALDRGDKSHSGPVYNPHYPEYAFVNFMNSVLGFSEKSRAFFLASSAPRYLVISGENNLSILAGKGIQFPGRENYLQRELKPDAPPALRL